MMEMQTVAVELQANNLNSAMKGVTVNQQKQTGSTQRSFKSALESVRNENRGSDHDRDVKSVETTEKQPDLTPVIVPMTISFTDVQQAMLGLKESEATNATELSLTEGDNTLSNAADLAKVLTETVQKQVFGLVTTSREAQVPGLVVPIGTGRDAQVPGSVVPTDTGREAQVPGSVVPTDTGRDAQVPGSVVPTDTGQVFAIAATNLDEQVLEPAMLTDVVLTQESEITRQIKLSSDFPLAKEAAELNPKVANSVPEQPAQQTVAIKMSNGEVLRKMVAAEVSSEDLKQQKMKPAPTTVNIVMAAEDTLVIATEMSTAQDQGFETDLAQSTLSVSIPAQGKTDIAEAAFPNIQTPIPIKDQVLQQIVQKANILIYGGQQQINIQLKPEHLGQLSLLISVENGAVTAKFHTDSQQVKQLLEASLPQLKQELQAQGMKVQQVDVSVGQQPMSFSDFSRQASHYNQGKAKRVGKIAPDDLEEQFSNMATSVSKFAGLSSGVDYRV